MHWEPTKPPVCIRTSNLKYTTGFASVYQDDHTVSAPDFNRLLRPYPASCFVFTMRDAVHLWGIQNGDSVVVDRNLKPRCGDLILLQDGNSIRLRQWLKDQHGVYLLSSSQTKARVEGGEILHGVVRAHIHYWHRTPNTDV